MPAGLTGISKTSYGWDVPSPVGHALGGAIVGKAMAPSAVLICALAGVLPDIDFAWGGHNRETHSIGAALIRLARAAEGVHRLERRMLDRLAAGGARKDAHPAAADSDPTGTCSTAAPAHFEEVDG